MEPFVLHWKVCGVSLLIEASAGEVVASASWNGRVVQRTRWRLCLGMVPHYEIRED